MAAANCWIFRRNSWACFRLQNIRTDVALILHFLVDNEWPIYRLLLSVIVIYIECHLPVTSEFKNSVQRSATPISVWLTAWAIDTQIKMDFKRKQNLADIARPQK